MKAYLKNHRQAPRKMRLIAEYVRGMRLDTALAELDFMKQKAAAPIAKLLRSALANARQEGEQAGEGELIIRTITVDKGMTFFRYMPRARGRASPIAKETSHIFVELGAQQNERQKAKRKSQSHTSKAENDQSEPVAA